MTTFEWRAVGRDARKAKGPQLSSNRVNIELTADDDDGDHSEHDVIVFDDDNGPMYHPGDLEVDYESHVWADHDENCHGDIDCNANRRRFPEGFLWSCCEVTGEEGGCRKGEMI